MQINRLNLIFPPTTPGTAGASAQPEPLQAEGEGARAPSMGLGAVPSRKAVAVEPTAPAAVAGATAGVTLALGSGQKAAASGIYTRVNILRDFDIGKSVLGGETASVSQVDVLSTSRFGSFKQAVAKLNVFA